MPWKNELLCRIQFQDHTGVQSLLQSGTSANRKCDDDPSPLLIAIQNSDFHMVQLLLDHDALVNIQDSDGESALHYATQDTVEHEVMEILLRAEADLNCLNKWLRTPLHYVCYGGDFNKMETILQLPGTLVNVQDEDGNTCLHALMTFDEDENDGEFWSRAINMLIEAGVDVNITNTKGQTALHMAAEHEFQPEIILSALLNQSVDFEFELQDANGNNFLLSYIRRQGSDRPLLFKILNEQFQSFQVSSSGSIGNIVNMEAEDSETPFLRFLFGSSHFDLNIFQEFVRVGANINKPNSLGRTPLHRVMATEIIGNRRSVCRILLDGGANTNLQDEFGLTPIFWARSVKQISLICDAGAEVTITDKFGRNAMMNLQAQRNLKAIEELLLRGCSVNACDKNGSTALHYAVWMNDINMVETFVRVGGNTSLADEENRTPVKLAELLGYTKIYDFLKGHNIESCSLEAEGQKGSVKVIYQRHNFSERNVWPGNQLIINYEDFVKAENDTELLEMQRYNGKVLAKQLLLNPGSGKLFDNQETNQVIDAVQSLIKRLSKRISQRDPRLKNDIIPMGSMREGTKTGYPDEFDFVCCLSGILEHCHIMNDNVQSQENFVRVKLKEEAHLPSKMEAFFDRNGYLKTYDVRIELFRLIWKILLEKELWQDTQILYVSEDEENGFDHMAVLNFQILWIGRLFKGLKISIDLVPAIRVVNNFVSFSKRDNSRIPLENMAIEAGHFLLLQPPEDISPKTIETFQIEDVNLSRTEIIYDSDTRDYFNSLLRLSCAPMEVSFLESLPNFVRESYRLAKIIRSQCPKVRFTSNFFKELYDRDAVEITQCGDVRFDPGEYDECCDLVRSLKEASGTDEENILEMDEATNAMQTTSGSLLKSDLSDVASSDCSSNISDLSYDTDNDEESETTDPIYEANEDITSYMLENALFHLIGKQPELCDEDKNQRSDEERWQTTVDLTIKIFEFLKSVNDTGELLVYFLPQQNLFEFMYEFRRPGDQEAMRREIHTIRSRRRVFLNLILTIMRAS